MAKQVQGTSEVGTGSVKPSPEKFVEVCCEATKQGKSIKWIASQLNVKESYVTTTRQKLRAAGVPLPDLQKGGGGATANRIDEKRQDELMSLIAKQTNTPLAEIKKVGAELKKKAEQRATATA